MPRLYFTLRSGNVETPRYVRIPDGRDYTPREQASLVVMVLARTNGCSTWLGPIQAGRLNCDRIWRATLGTSPSDGLTPQHMIEFTLDR